MIERQELYCHNCSGYVQFDDDMSIDGNRVLVCPRCNHQHFRVVRGGKITEERWGQDPSQRYGNSITISNVTYASTSAYSYTYTSAGTSTVSSGTYYISSSWLNTQST